MRTSVFYAILNRHEKAANWPLWRGPRGGEFLLRGLFKAQVLGDSYRMDNYCFSKPGSTLGFQAGLLLCTRWKLPLNKMDVQIIP